MGYSYLIGLVNRGIDITQINILRTDMESEKSKMDDCGGNQNEHGPHCGCGHSHTHSCEHSPSMGYHASCGKEVPKNPPTVHYALELYYEHLPNWEIEKVEAALRRRSPSIVRLPRSTDTTFLFEHPDHPITGSYGSTASICCLAINRTPPDPERLWSSLEQSWGWNEAGETLARCRGSILLTDLVPPGGTIMPLERLILLQNALVSLIETVPPIAIHWTPAQHFIPPQEFLDAYQQAGGFVGVPGVINVRVLPEALPGLAPEAEKTTDSSASNDQTPHIRLDTMGLAPLGFADFQIDATGLPIAQVVRVLYNTALYVLEHGSVIRDGHTIPGLIPTGQTQPTHWSCYLDTAWTAPNRTVLTIHPDASAVPFTGMTSS